MKNSWFVTVVVVVSLLVAYIILKLEPKSLAIVQEWQGREIIFPDSITFAKFGKETIDYKFSEAKYKVLVYTDSLGCMSCKLHLPQWKKFIHQVDSLTNNSVPFLFFFQSNDFDEVNYILRRDRFDLPICFDKEDRLNSLNKFPSQHDFQSFLLDKDNKVVIIGNPVNNPKIKKLYLDMITGVRQPESKHKLTEILIERPSLNVGSFNIGNPKLAAFTIENTGNNPLIITDVISSCGCTLVKYEPTPIKSGDKIEIFVEIQPERKGAFNESLTVYCNVAQSPVVLNISGVAE